MPGKINDLEVLLKKNGALRVRELENLGFPRTYLSELAKRGKAVRQERGIYTHPDCDIPNHFSYALACSKVPGGVVCLLSALLYHEIGTQSPHEVWMAIDRKARIPKIDYPSVRFVRFSGPALSEGIEEIEGPYPFKIYNPAKTVADCFKYRNKIGVDVAVEALKDGWRERKFRMDKLSYYARICRVYNVMAPYLESIL
jgi:predicted transcriptional regulator of viral defense system